jgi:hypothetical protein
MKRRKFLIDLTLASTVGPLALGSQASAGSPEQADFRDGIILQNDDLRIVLSGRGMIRQLDDLRGKRSYKTDHDAFRIRTGEGVFSNHDLPVTDMRKTADGAVFCFRLNARSVYLHYRLRSGAAYFERWLLIPEGSSPLTLLNIEWESGFSDSPGELLVYDSFWNASTVSFLRWERGGLFCGVENPFFKTARKGGTFVFGYEPSLILKQEETHLSDPQFIGVYTKKGRAVTDYYPQTVKGHYPRFRNPCGHKPLDLAEVRAMQRFVADYLAVSLSTFKFINYHFFYPLPQMPAPGSPEEKTILNVVKTFRELEGDLFIFNPMYPYTKPEGRNDACWELGPEGSAAKRIMDEAAASGIGFGYYMGCARHGLEGNASALPFASEKKEWKKQDDTGTFAGENCMACDEFADWWLNVQSNTITKYGLKLWSWDPGPGNGKFCYNEKHGHLPGKGAYKGWRNATELMRRLKEKHPGLFLMAFYGRKEYGLWGFKYFDQHESYWEQTVPFQASIHPDLHADRVNADGIRFQSWWNQHFRFMPPQINHVLAHRIQEGFWDTRLPRAWDHTGWKYSILSALACGGGIMTVILPDAPEHVPGLKDFYKRWLQWGKDHFDLAKYNVPFGEQLRAGGVDGRARIHQGHGFLFLCNQNPRPARIAFSLDEEIGLEEEGVYTLREIYPAEGGFFFDDAHPQGLFRKGSTITCTVPAYQIVLMELSAPARSGSPLIPDQNTIRQYLSEQAQAPVRMLDRWTREDRSPFHFPFHAEMKNTELTTRFFANEKIRHLLESNRPPNLDEFEALIPEWKKNYPDNFAWARPDRLWFAMPSVNAAAIGNPQLKINGKPVALDCHIIAGRPIIHYADISDSIIWNAENEIKIRLEHAGRNQFLGPYLDYPPDETELARQGSRKICSLLAALHTKGLVYEKLEDPDMPERVRKTGEPVRVIESVAVDPVYFREEKPSVVLVKLNISREETEQVWISLPYGDAPMDYRESGEWTVTFAFPKREGLIMDIAFLRVWAVLKNGLVSEPADIPVQWRYGMPADQKIKS